MGDRPARYGYVGLGCRERGCGSDLL